MKQAHINCVSVGIFSWSSLEPEEGHYTFGWLKEIVDCLYQNHIYTILATPSGARPVWMAHKYPEVLRVDETLHRNRMGSRHNHCYTSPAYRENEWALDAACGPRNGAMHYEETIQSHYQAFWRLGINVDLINETDDLTGYKLVVAPMLYLHRDGIADKLRRFVSSGSTLVGTYWSGLVDENDCFGTENFMNWYTSAAQKRWLSTATISMPEKRH